MNEIFSFVHDFLYNPVMEKYLQNTRLLIETISGLPSFHDAEVLEIIRYFERERMSFAALYFAFERLFQTELRGFLRNRLGSR